MTADLVSVFALLLSRSILAADLGPGTQLILAATVAGYSPRVETAMKQELSRAAAGDLSKPDTDTKTEETRASRCRLTASSAALATST